MICSFFSPSLFVTYLIYLKPDKIFQLLNIAPSRDNSRCIFYIHNEILYTQCLNIYIYLIFFFKQRDRFNTLIVFYGIYKVFQMALLFFIMYHFFCRIDFLDNNFLYK